MKQPVARGAPKSVQVRSKLGMNQIPPSAKAGPMDPLQTPLSPTKLESTPHFARDTNASRLAREQRMGSVNAALHHHPSLQTVRESGPSLQPVRENGPLAQPARESNPLKPVTTNWKAHIEAKQVSSPRPRRGRGPPQKPRLIQAGGPDIHRERTEKGMRWNPTLLHWEGNENALVPFDIPVPDTSSPGSGASNGASKAAPALIANVGASKGVQVVGGMVFDPQRMCWLKMAPQQASSTHRGSSSNPMSPSTIEDDDDPFAGLEDLDDGKDKKSVSGAKSLEVESLTGATSKSYADDEWLVGEEFDVGPEFIKRQKAEEDKWRRKVEGWVGIAYREAEADLGDNDWRWSIRKHVGAVGRAAWN